MKKLSQINSNSLVVSILITDLARYPVKIPDVAGERSNITGKSV